MKPQTEYTSFPIGIKKFISEHIIPGEAHFGNFEDNFKAILKHLNINDSIDITSYELISSEVFKLKNIKAPEQENLGDFDLDDRMRMLIVASDKATNEDFLKALEKLSASLESYNESVEQQVYEYQSSEADKKKRESRIFFLIFLAFAITILVIEYLTGGFISRFF